MCVQIYGTRTRTPWRDSSRTEAVGDCAGGGTCVTRCARRRRRDLRPWLCTAPAAGLASLAVHGAGGGTWVLGCARRLDHVRRCVPRGAAQPPVTGSSTRNAQVPARPASARFASRRRRPCLLSDPPWPCRGTRRRLRLLEAVSSVTLLSHAPQSRSSVAICVSSKLSRAVRPRRVSPRPGPGRHRAAGAQGDVAWLGRAADARASAGAGVDAAPQTRRRGSRRQGGEPILELALEPARHPTRAIKERHPATRARPIHTVICWQTPWFGSRQEPAGFHPASLLGAVDIFTHARARAGIAAPAAGPATATPDSHHEHDAAANEQGEGAHGGRREAAGGAQAVSCA